MFKKGDKVKVASHNDNECYESFRDKVLIIVSVANSTEEHQGYDESLGQSLYDLETEEGEAIPCSLYDYELEEI